MSKINLITMAGGLLRPADDEAADRIRRWGVGNMVVGDFVRPRNYALLKKFFALIEVAWEEWDPPESQYQGVPAYKSKERLREELIILAGYYDVCASLKGETRVIAKSISFANMSEDEFGELFNAVHQVIMDKILNDKRWQPEDLDVAVDRVMNFL